MQRRIHPLIVVAVIVALSLVTAGVLFGILDSTGVVQSRYAKFGGAAAAFFAALYTLKAWYDRLEKRYSDVEGLTAEIKAKDEVIQKFNVPAFQVPPAFNPYIDYEHSMLFCYPDEWRRQPMELQIQSLFSEDPLALRPGDEVPGRFAIAISTPGQKTYSLKEIVLMAKSADITVDEVSQELGVQVTVKTESLQVPLERVFTLLGAKGQDRRSQIYDLNSKYLDLMPGKTVREDTEIVDGIESLVVERTLPQEATEDLVQFFVITYLEKADLIFTFIFTDNIGDRDKIDTIRKKVLATVKYWKPSAPQQLPKSLAANSKPDAA